MKTLSLFILSLCLPAFYTNTLLSADWKVYVAKYRQGKTCAVTYTFDDGLAEHSTVVAPELEKRGFRGTFWVCGYYTEQGAASRSPRMTWEELRKMAENGHEISNHSWSHKNAKRLTLEQVKAEIEKNDSAIFARTGTKPVTYCYPYNYKTDEIVELASRNRVGTRTRQISIGSKSTPQRLARWLAELMKKEEWGVGMTHGIHYGYDAFSEPSLFWEHLDKVKSLEEQIWVGTFREVAAYIQERDHIQLKVSEGKRRYTILPEMALDKQLFTEPLTLVMEGKSVKKVSVRQGRKRLAARICGDRILFDFNPHGGKIRVSFK